jgi:hypothetical protein
VPIWISIYLSSLSSGLRALESRRSSKQSLVLPFRVHLVLAQGTRHKLACIHSHGHLCLYRCPTECQLTRSSKPWRCIVSLRKVTNEKGVPLPRPCRIEFGEPIFAKHLVTERICRAQRAILNPDTPTNNFLEAPFETLEERQLSFSSNSVCLEISGKDVDDLSFVDLPGTRIEVINITD